MKSTTLVVLGLAFAAIQPASARDVRAAGTSAASPPALSVECEAFLNRVDRCMQTLGADPSISNAYKQNLDVARSEWKSAPDQALIGNVCHLANDAFDRTAANAKCEQEEVAVVTH